eukprot:m.130548 g.130548  ORF g.130548 m.130548 type:complete len:335 (+) comp29484_c0_seq2:266-1270(+)
MNIGKGTHKSQSKLTSFFTTTNTSVSGGGEKKDKGNDVSPTNMGQTNTSVLTESAGPNQRDSEHGHGHEHEHVHVPEYDKEHDHEHGHVHVPDQDNGHEHGHENGREREREHAHEPTHDREHEHPREQQHPHHHHTTSQAIDVQANVVTRRRSTLVRPPKFSNHPQKLQEFSDRLQKKQKETLEEFRLFKASQRWGRLHQSHFDWWMFPIDDGSRRSFNVTSEAHVSILSSNHEFMQNYLEGVTIMAEAWGWDLRVRRWIPHRTQGQGWSNWDVRLAKVCRSLWLFKRVSELESMQQYAREVQQLHKNGESFTYGRFTLDELLHFKLETRSRLI